MYICEACGTDISIHALREEGDRAVSRMPSPYSRFLSTPSARKATHRARPSHPGSQNFYPRPPRGRRHTEHGLRIPALKISIHALREEGDICSLGYDQLAQIFLSTPSARKATDGQPHTPEPWEISIHALREEGDTASRDSLTITKKISIHALREEGDSKNRDKISIFL